MIKNYQVKADLTNILCGLLQPNVHTNYLECLINKCTC